LNFSVILRCSRRRSSKDDGTHERVLVMAGLVPAIHVLQIGCMSGGFVYIVTNKPNGILYISVTNDLIRRVHEHREGAVDGFTKRHGLKRLIWFRQHDDIRAAIQREKTMKHWPRAWKARTINAQNPDWNDLFDGLL
jgi:putative endonuclease